MPTSTEFRVVTHGNRIQVHGTIGVDFRRLLATIHNLTQRSGYQDLILDCSKCEAAFAGGMLAVCANMMQLRRAGIDCKLILPEATRLAGLFRNTGWAHLIDPAHHPASVSKSFVNVPAVVFSSPAEQKAAVDKLMDTILSSMTFLDRKDLEAIEWSLNEISDNVLVHAQSDVGGVLQMTTYSAKRRVEFVVADAGLGIPHTLRSSHPEINSDATALERAVREGVTRDRKIGQGNGLFGSFQVAQVSKGYFHIHSGHAHLGYDEKRGLRISSEQIPHHGSVIVGCLDCSDPSTLGEALRLEGYSSQPYGYIEERFTPEPGGEIIFRLKTEASSFGSRLAGEPIRTKLTNLVQLHPTQKVIVEFEGITLISSSFADEVIGKLFVELGPINFMRSIEIRTVSRTVRSLLDRAIVQRSSTGL